MTYDVDPELADYLARSSGLAPDVCRRLVLEVLAQYSETLEDFVQRRHRELRSRSGLKNDQIYECILHEVQNRRFGAPDITARQIRRMIYG